MFERRLLLASLFAQTLINIFPQVKIASYEANGWGFVLRFSLAEKLDDTFLKLFREALDLLLTQASLYPMTMMADVARTYLQQERQELLAQKYQGRGLVDLVKIGARALPAPHVPLGRCHFEMLPLTKEEGVWSLKSAVFADKKDLKAFLKLYAEQEHLDPGKLAVREGLVAESGYWLSPGLDLLESLRKSEEHFWRQRGFMRVFAGSAPGMSLPAQRILWAPIFTNSLNINMLDSSGPRIWAVDQTKSLHLDQVESLFKALKAPYRQEKNSLLVGDHFGTFYETARMVSSPANTEISLFASPAQILALLLQETRGDMRQLERLQKEMFEFSR